MKELLKVYGQRLSISIFDIKEKKQNADCLIECSKVYGFSVPFTQAGGFKSIFSIYKMIGKIEEENDLLIVQLPFIGFPALLSIRKPTVFHLCANVLTAAKNPFKYRGIKLLASKAFAGSMHSVFKRLFSRKNSALIVNGKELHSLYEKYSPVEVVSSSVRLEEVISVEKVGKRSENDPFKVLFIGRPSKEKGFHTLIKAFRHLKDGGRHVTLELLGVKANELNSILDEPVPSEYLDSITFHGFISWGDSFTKIVQSSHVLVMCSVSEGTPRVLIEARALGCPVIATEVGGIGSSVKHEHDGMLIPIGDHLAMAQAIEKLHQEKFRQQLSVNGLETVKNHTLEKFAARFQKAVDQINHSDAR